MDTVTGIGVKIEVTPRRISIVRDDRVTDIEMHSITGVEMAHPGKRMPGKFRIFYVGGQTATATYTALNDTTFIEFNKEQEEDFNRLRTLLHQYQDALVSLPQS